ncbi:MAG: trigger factor [Oscillospiraceae bacterium]|nr:trigger factor [Oscillospiraceae bacterium]
MIVKNLEKKEKNTAELTVEATAEEFEAAVNKAYLKGRGRISIPGFRKGKAPRKMIEAMYGTGAFYEDAAEELYPEMLQFGITEEKLDVVGRPSIADMKIGEEKNLTVKFVVALYPEVVVKDYKGIEAPKPAVKVLKKDVDREIDKVREQNARVETVERKAKKGDIATIDFEGFMEGVPFEGGKGEDYDLELGSGTFIPGFEEQIVGKKTGENFDVNVTFPTEYAPELAGKDATFKVTVKNVKEKILPELDDEFAKDVSEFDTLKEYQDSVKADLTAKRKSEAEEAFKNVVLSRLVDKVEGEIPDAMIEDHVDNMIGNFKYNISTQGMDFDTYLKMMGMSEEMLRVELRPTAEKEIKADLAYEYIAKTEKFEVTDEDVEGEYKRLADQYGMEIESIRKAVSADSVKTGLVIDKAKDFVLANAKVEKEKKAEDTAEAE